MKKKSNNRTHVLGKVNNKYRPYILTILLNTKLWYHQIIDDRSKCNAIFFTLFAKTRNITMKNSQYSLWLHLAK